MDEKRYLNFSLEELKDECRKLNDELSGLNYERKIESKTISNQIDIDYQLLIDSSFDWFWGIDENLKYNFCSPQVENILGYTPNELIGKYPFDIFDPNEKIRLATDIEKTINLKKNFKDLENWVIAKDGSKVCLLTNAFPIFNEKGEFKGYQGADRDITFKKLAEKKINDSERRFQTIVEDMMIGIAIHDGNTLKYTNPHLLKMVNANEKEDLQGKSIFDFIYKEDHQIVVDKYNNIQNLKNGKTDIVMPPINIRIYKTDGSLLNVETHSILINYNGSQHSLVTIQDITDTIEDKNKILNALIKAEESDALKTAFLQNLSHEIRTPLNGIMGFSGLLNHVEDLNRNEINDIIIYIKESGKRLIDIVEQIIEISRIETKQVTNELNCFSISDLFEDISLYYLHSINLKKLDFDVKVQENNNVYIQTDFKKLHRIISLILDNAIKFTNQGKIILGSYLENNYVIFYVKDTGIGIPIENQKRVFEKFSQVDFKTSRNYEGAGIGLAICKGFTQLLDGKIWFESVVGKGSIFYLKIPIRLDEPTSINNKSIKGIEDLTCQILVVDDSLTYLKYMNKIFKNSSINIKTANNGLEAIELVKSDNKITLIIMDLIMPHMDGFTTSKLIKDINPNIKIIAQTSYTKMSELKNISDFGIDGVIFKPFEKEELFELIDSIFKN